MGKGIFSVMERQYGALDFVKESGNIGAKSHQGSNPNNRIFKTRLTADEFGLFGVCLSSARYKRMACDLQGEGKDCIQAILYFSKTFNWKIADKISIVSSLYTVNPQLGNDSFRWILENWTWYDCCTVIIECVRNKRLEEFKELLLRLPNRLPELRFSCFKALCVFPTSVEFKKALDYVHSIAERNINSEYLRVMTSSLKESGAEDETILNVVLNNTCKGSLNLNYRFVLSCVNAKTIGHIKSAALKGDPTALRLLVRYDDGGDNLREVVKSGNIKMSDIVRAIGSNNTEISYNIEFLKSLLAEYEKYDLEDVVIPAITTLACLSHGDLKFLMKFLNIHYRIDIAILGALALTGKEEALTEILEGALQSINVELRNTCVNELRKLNGLKCHQSDRFPKLVTLFNSALKQLINTGDDGIIYTTLEFINCLDEETLGFVKELGGKTNKPEIVIAIVKCLGCAKYKTNGTKAKSAIEIIKDLSFRFPDNGKLQSAAMSATKKLNYVKTSNPEISR